MKDIMFNAIKDVGGGLINVKLSSYLILCLFIQKLTLYICDIEIYRPSIYHGGAFWYLFI